LELAEGYVNALEISTSPSSTIREVFEHDGRMTLYENGKRGGKDQTSRKWCDKVSNGSLTPTIFSGTLRSERKHVKNEAGQIRE
jgi:predicted hotdog family 3-hydroxylacyl-ACP dehydratase